MKSNFFGLLCFGSSSWSSLKTAINVCRTRLHINPLDDGFYIIFFHSVSSPHFTAWLGIPISCLHHPGQDEENLPWFRKTYSNRFIRTIVALSWVSPHKIYQCHILFDNSYSSSRYQPKSGVSWIPAQIWRSVWTIACIWCSDAGQLHKISATDGDWCGFYGNGQNTQRRPAKPWADSVDAILHNVHLHAYQMYRMNPYTPLSIWGLFELEPTWKLWVLDYYSTPEIPLKYSSFVPKIFSPVNPLANVIPLVFYSAHPTPDGPSL